MLVHKTSLAKDATEFALQGLRDQVGYRVYPAHRIDRKTAGVLLFSKSKDTNGAVQRLFRERKVQKFYLAIVRGFIPEEVTIDYALKEGLKIRAAQTIIRPIRQFEISVSSGKFSTSRYSLVELEPLTGRQHQLRKHMAHIFHPIIGDRPHGCNKQNRLWKNQFALDTMLLHAERLVLPVESGEKLEIKAPLRPPFHRALQILNENSVSTP